MTLPTISGPAMTGVVKQATPANAQATIDGAAEGTEVRLGAGVYSSRLNVVGKRIRLLLQAGCELRGSMGLYISSPNVEVRGEPGCVVTASGDGAGIFVNGGRVLISQSVKVTGCKEQGIYGQPVVAGDAIQVDRCDLSNNGGPSAFSWVPGYWRYGCHDAYLGGGKANVPYPVYFYDNYVHDQPQGYGAQFGGQVQNGFIVWNRVERVTAAADSAEAGDQLGNGLHFFSSYAGTRNNLVVNNLGRNIAGYLVAANQTSLAGTAKNNVGWQCAKGVVHYTYGAAQSVTDGGGNVIRDMPTLQACFDAGLFDPAYVPPWVMPTPPPGPTNRQLVEAAKAELEQTTVSGKNWVAGGRKPGHWADAYKLLDRIGDLP